MPSREEIVEWLREAASQLLGYQQIQWRNGKIKKSDKILALSEVFRRRATQVAAMRCETCKWSDNPIDESVLCMPLDKRFNKNFGCFHHEPKEKE